MRRILPVIIVLGTALLLLARMVGRQEVFKLRAERSASTPEQAVRALMADIQARNWDKAYASLDHANAVQQSDFVRENRRYGWESAPPTRSSKVL